MVHQRGLCLQTKLTVNSILRKTAVTDGQHKGVSLLLGAWAVEVEAVTIRLPSVSVKFGEVENTEDMAQVVKVASPRWDVPLAHKAQTFLSNTKITTLNKPRHTTKA
jgi:hypothetical protein